MLSISLTPSVTYWLHTGRSISLHKALFDPLSNLPLRAGWTVAICRACGCVKERGRSHVWEMLLRGHSSETAQSDMTPYCQRSKALLVHSHPNWCELVWCLRMPRQVSLWLNVTEKAKVKRDKGRTSRLNLLITNQTILRRTNLSHMS